MGRGRYGDRRAARRQQRSRRGAGCFLPRQDRQLQGAEVGGVPQRGAAADRPWQGRQARAARSLLERQGTQDMNFLENYWYAAAWAEEIRATPLARRILDRPVALFRTESGRAAAFDDCCPHRMVPLSRGRVEGETLRCAYHGLRFDCSGQCVEVPGQVNIPPRARVNSYPLVERWQLAWIWMGDPALADPALIPELTWLDSPAWRDAHGTITYECNYVLLLDNLIDLSHTTFVHQRTIGTDDVAKTPIKTTGDARRVLVERTTNDTEPSVMYKRAGGFTG